MRRCAHRARAAALLLLAASAFGCASHVPEFERVTWRERMQGWRESAQRTLERHVERDSLARVRPWERDLLAREDMGFDYERLRARRRSHIFFSKEASLGGGGVGGGGCGCN